jgi:uncharacterized protein
MVLHLIRWLYTEKHQKKSQGPPVGTIPGRPPSRNIMYKGVNIFGEPLKTCSMDPKTGFFRDGCCNTGEQDFGMHTVCVVMTGEFLAFSKERGNDLSTPRPQWNFPGLKEGDRWCLCAGRWLEAWQAGKAPLVDLEVTHEETLRVVPIDILIKYAVQKTK